jgi:hypothetical protein
MELKQKGAKETGVKQDRGVYEHACTQCIRKVIVWIRSDVA